MGRMIMTDYMSEGCIGGQNGGPGGDAWARHVAHKESVTRVLVEAGANVTFLYDVDVRSPLGWRQIQNEMGADEELGLMIFLHGWLPDAYHDQQVLLWKTALMEMWKHCGKDTVGIVGMRWNDRQHLLKDLENWNARCRKEIGWEMSYDAKCLSDFPKPVLEKGRMAYGVAVSPNKDKLSKIGVTGWRLEKEVLDTLKMGKTVVSFGMHTLEFELSLAEYLAEYLVPKGPKPSDWKIEQKSMQFLRMTMHGFQWRQLGSAPTECEVLEPCERPKRDIRTVPNPLHEGKADKV